MGFYAEITIVYDAAIAQEKYGRPFAIESLRPIQLSKVDALAMLQKGRRQFTTDEWKRLLIRSVGLEPEALSERAQSIALLRMLPFVERNYNLVEIGPRGTGKSQRGYLFPLSFFVDVVDNSSGKASLIDPVWNMVRLVLSGKRVLTVPILEVLSD